MEDTFRLAVEAHDEAGRAGSFRREAAKTKRQYSQLSSREFWQPSVFIQESNSNFGNGTSTLFDVDIKRFL